MKMLNIVAKKRLYKCQRSSLTIALIGIMLLAFSSVSLGLASHSAIQSKQDDSSQHEKQFALNQKKDASQQTVSLEIEDGTLISALSRLAKKVDVGFSYQEYAIPDKKVTVNFNKVSIYEALNVLLERTNLEATLAPDRDILIIRQKLNQDLKAQLETVTGTVTDAQSGETLPGVNVMVKGTTVGASTDSEGNYELEAPSLQDTLIFSFVGYQTQEVPIEGRTSIDAALQAQAISGEEMVVVGYGTQKTETVTGSISSIQTEEIKQSPSSNLKVSLAGRLPGLTSIQTTGEPGRDATLMYLRGRGTINGQNPLVLVDGVERDLSYIDPNEVADVSILKDASATAVFGVRGANGVILVTTKRGKGGKPEINFSAEYGLQEFTREPNVVNDSYEWALLKNQAAKNDGQPPIYSDYALDQFQQGGNPLYPTNNWRDILLHDVVPQSRYNLNLSGGAGGGSVRYFVNVGMLDQGGQWKIQQDDYDPSSNLKRYNFRSNVDVDLNESLKAFLNVAGYLEKVNSPNADANLIFASLNEQAPVRPGPLTPEGEVMTFTSATQPPPYGYINRSGYRQETRSNVIASFGMEQDLSSIAQGLSAKLMASFDTRSNYRLTGARSYEEWIVNEVSGGEDFRYERLSGENSSLSLSTGTDFESKSNFQLFVNYENTFSEKHEITGLLFGQREQLNRPGDNIPFNLIGVSSRLTYNYDSKYFLELNAGYNGSEQFSEGNRFGFLPAISAGWLISGENFLEDNPGITHLKIRGSYGEVGNDQLGGRRFLYLDDIQSGGGGYSPSLSGTINENFIGNPNIQWEIAKKINLGLEIGLYDQLDITVDLFRERRDNVLVGGASSAPILNGLPLGALAPTNSGKIENKGYEIVLNYQKAINEDFSILSRLNFNYAHNKIEDIGEPKRPEDYAYPLRAEGFPIGQQFGYITDGYFNSQEEIDSYADYNIGKSPRPGDFIYKDLNGDNIIDEKDIAPVGYSSVPEYTFGVSASVNYKNFDLSFLFQGVANVSNNVPESGWGVFEQYNFYDRHRRAWTSERATAGKSIGYPALGLSQSSSEIVPNSFFIERTDYIRLKNVEIGYTLPVDMTGKIGSRKVRLYANGLNLLTWDKMSFKDYDPELAGSLRYPIYRVVNFGINVAF
jgi:TonB-linked SusC/RagA family outer membrane protein